MPEVIVENVHKSFGSVEVLKGVSLTVERGEVIALIGRSGSGKSTLLRCINGLEKINSGRIEIAGHTVSSDPRQLRELRRDVGIVFQSYNLFPHLSVGDNIMLAPKIVKNVARAQSRETAEKVLKLVGLSEKFDAYPDELSGGQQQRVAIARALITDPRLIVADEPTGDLDRASATDVLSLLKRLNTELGKTLIMVTHDAHAAGAAQSLVHLEKGELIDGHVR